MARSSWRVRGSFVVFLYNIQMVLPAKSKDKVGYGDQYEHLPQKAALAAKRKCAIVMVHYAKKADGWLDPKSLESILGSTVITGACDMFLLLQNSDNGQAYTPHVTGKFMHGTCWNMVKQNGFLK